MNFIGINLVDYIDGQLLVFNFKDGHVKMVVEENEDISSLIRKLSNVVKTIEVNRC